MVQNIRQLVYVQHGVFRLFVGEMSRCFVVGKRGRIVYIGIKKKSMLRKSIGFVCGVALLLMLLPATLLAQETVAKRDSSWVFSGNASLTFNQVALVNWVAGGENTLSGEAAAFLSLKYEKRRAVWTNTLNLAYGLMRQGENPVMKNMDRIDFNSQFGYKAARSWYYSAALGVKTQFAPGYKDAKSDVKISDAFSPLYLLLSLGADWRPDKHFSLLLSPLTGRMTYVRSQMLADLGAFGMKKAEYDPHGVLITPGEHSRWELGGFLKATYSRRFFKDQFGVNSKLELFTNYLEKPENVDVNFDVVLDYKLNNWLTARAQVTLIYDDDMKVTLEDGIQVAKLQVREMFGIGLAYHF